MKLLDKYKNSIGGIEYKGYGFLWLNPFVKGIPMKRVKKLQFSQLYPHIICGLIDSGYHEMASDKLKMGMIEFSEKFNYFCKNKSLLKSDPELYKEYKMYINSFYGTIGYMSKVEDVDYIEMLGQYLTAYYTDLLKANTYKILYIDTDTIFYCGELDLLGFNINYDIEEIPYILIEEKKRYITKKEDFEAKGYRGKNIQNAIDLLKTIIRDDKIEKLGI
jgi:DNA polymerase elongation subunit (family B)